MSILAHHLHLRLAGLLICLATYVLLSGSATAQPYSMPAIDAPELAKLGSYSVGVRTLEIVNPDQPDVAKLVKTFGIMGKSNRTLPLLVWYPATHAANAENARYTALLPSMTGGNQAPVNFTHTGIAVRDAAPVASLRFPLVIVSHGFGGWNSFMTYLTENIASKGYVVAAIDHSDAKFTDGKGFVISFGGAVVHRARDQQYVIDHFIAWTKKSDDNLAKIIDATRIGLIGYSMGGFGALTTAGAGYDSASPTFKQIPSKLLASVTEGNPKYQVSTDKYLSNLKATVLIAPWGGQTANRAWTTKSLQRVRTPTLLIAGDQDDISEYNDGVKFLFQNMTGTARHMLVYQNARHNIGGNPAPPEALRTFTIREYFEEPVWRKDRITAINQHFVTAFLDRYLKEQAGRAAYLELPTVIAADGKWPTTPGQQTGANFSTGKAETANYWKGFQRRWALGLEMHTRKAGE
jgi:predicted dienelactone hydrolase